MTSYPCPACLTEANLDTGCPGCGRAPDPLAAEVIQLDGQIAALPPKIEAARAEVVRAQAAYTALADEMQAAQRRRSQLAAQVWAAVHTPAAVPVPSTVQPPVAARPEASTQTVKNVLFVLGGILLSIAAIVFTAFAWGTFGMPGKAAILGVFTAATLSVPALALRRNLRGTAETFAALGLLLVVLDGYAIWRVNLAGVQGAVSGLTYAGVVAGVAAVIAVAYGRLTALTAPGIFGLAAAQPVLPLVFATLVDGRYSGFALVFAAVSAANLPVVRLRFSALQILSTIAYAVSLVIAHAFAFAALAEAQGGAALAIAGAVTMLAGAVALAGPIVRPAAYWLTAAAAWCVGLVVLVGAVAAARLDAEHARLWTVGLIAVLALVTALVEVKGRGALWRGLLIGSAATGGIAALVVAGYVTATATATLSQSDNVAIEVALLTAGAIAMTRRWLPLAAGISAVAGAIGIALAAPAGFTAGWVAPAVDLAVTALLVAAVLGLRPHEVFRGLAAVGVTVLPAHAIAASADSAAEMAYTLGGCVVIAVGTAVVGRWRDRIAGVAAVAVTAPLVVALSGAVAWTVHSGVIHAIALTAAGLPLAVWAVRRWYPQVADRTARVTVLATMLIAVLAPDDTWSKSVYVAGAAVALAVLPRTGLAERIAGWAVLGIGLIAAQPPLVVVLVPYGSLISEVAYPAVTAAEVVAIAVLTAALWGNRSLLYSALPVPMALALVYFGLTWPWLPLALLASGLALVAYAVRRSPWCAPFGLLLAGSGLSGLSVEYWSLITGLSVVCVAALALAWFTRVRVPGWLVFGLAWLGLALTSARAAGLPDRAVAFVVLLAAAVLVLASVLLPHADARALRADARTLPADSRALRADARVLEIPAQLAALAVIVSVPSAARLSEACLVWGIALGLSVLPRRTAARVEWLVRLGFAGALEIAALWALLISRDVQAVEAYSLPLAGVALLVGFLAMRRDPTLTSWIGYGPALVAAFGPSLAVILPAAGDPWRRLGLGLAALAVVIAGAVRRRQAPVVIGGAVLIVVALHEVTQVWSRLPLWLPIGVGGGILIGLAITYERRLRDLRTLRTRISSFS